MSLTPPMQHDEGKLEDLLKEVASTDPPANAPAPPLEDIDSDDNMELLPSQRDGGEWIWGNSFKIPTSKSA